jgi:hypothetical protein
MHRTIYLAVILVSMNWAPPVAAAVSDRMIAIDPAAATRFAGLALKCLHTEYPNHISHTMDDDADARPPHALNPAFYGCYDWHSDVHGHWLCWCAWCGCFRMHRSRPWHGRNSPGVLRRRTLPAR